MMPTIRPIHALIAVSLLASGATIAQPAGVAPLGEWVLVPATGVEADMAFDQAAGELTLGFSKSSPEPRLIAFAAACEGIPPEAQTLVLTGRLTLDATAPAQVVLGLWEGDGACWYKTVTCELPHEGFGDVSIPVTGTTLARFSTDDSGALEPETVERLWIGVLLSGPAKGSLTLTGAALSEEPYRASKPLRLVEGEGAWSVGADPAVVCDLTTPNEGPDGQACLRYTFTQPGNRHMYCTPAHPVPSAGLEGYSALRMTYKAELPAGINGLLVMLTEGGAQFAADPPPPETAEWQTITIPLEQFTLGAWSQDDNGVLDMSRVDRVIIGVHGASTDDPATGTVWATDIELVP